MLLLVERVLQVQGAELVLPVQVVELMLQGLLGDGFHAPHRPCLHHRYRVERVKMCASCVPWVDRPLNESNIFMCFF